MNVYAHVVPNIYRNGTSLYRDPMRSSSIGLSCIAAMVAMMVVITKLPPPLFPGGLYYTLPPFGPSEVHSRCPLLVPFRTCTPLISRLSWMGVTRCPETTGR